MRLLLGLTFSVAFPVAGALAAVWGTLTEQLSFISTIFMFFVVRPLFSLFITFPDRSHLFLALYHAPIFQRGGSPLDLRDPRRHGLCYGSHVG